MSCLNNSVYAQLFTAVTDNKLVNWHPFERAVEVSSVFMGIGRINTPNITQFTTRC
ncbi:MAG: hypothetical protein ACJAZT_001679 [Gammaproteobacteria bacterium]|jgi:hypothetical protein